MTEHNKVFSNITRWLTEFFVIVIGVLAALAVDEWRENRQNTRNRNILLNEMVTDLEADAGDINQFMNNSKERVEASLRLANEEVEDSDERVRLISLIGFSSRLEIAQASYNEITSSGAINSLENTELRVKISSYYALAQDRIDINDILFPQILRFRAALEELGYPYTGSGDIPSEVINNPKVKALIITLGKEAENVEWYVRDLKEANIDLHKRLVNALK